MRIALIAHDDKKDDLIRFVKEHLNFFKQHELFATGHTGALITENTGLEVYCFLSGPLGGDQQIGSKIACKKIDLVIFFRDPLTAQPHEPDVSALIRLCDVHKVPIATNSGTAALMVKCLEKSNT
ncbi:MAG: methylglyoxal synthase [Clostridia bacterium]|jgi:methylglyoxal synthase|nr:mgsA [Clostridiales bacterium]MDK2985772.1 methylglyoxal synthase [Clostridia bacterium]